MNIRAALLESALYSFASLGYDATGTQLICDAVGVTKPTLYHYFKSKQGLLDALLREHFEAFMLTLTGACTYQGDLTMSLEMILRTYFGFAERNPAFYRWQYSLAYAPRESTPYAAARPWVQRQHALLCGLFLAAERDHGNMRARSEAYARTLLGMINTYIMPALADESELTDALLYQARHQFMHGIFS